jgi:hypothetical protein
MLQAGAMGDLRVYSAAACGRLLVLAVWTEGCLSGAGWARCWRGLLVGYGLSCGVLCRREGLPW